MSTGWNSNEETEFAQRVLQGIRDGTIIVQSQYAGHLQDYFRDRGEPIPEQLRGVPRDMMLFTVTSTNIADGMYEQNRARVIGVIQQLAEEGTGRAAFYRETTVDVSIGGVPGQNEVTYFFSLPGYSGENNVGAQIQARAGAALADTARAATWTRGAFARGAQTLEQTQGRIPASFEGEVQPPDPDLPLIASAPRGVTFV